MTSAQRPSSLRCAALSLSIFVLSVLAPRIGAAQESTIVTLACELTDASWLDEDALARRITVLSGTPVAREAHEGARSLSVRMTAVDRAHVSLLEPDGRRIEREAELPDDRTERTETVAILAANLLRDESAELLALLRPAETDDAADGESAVTAEVEATDPGVTEVAERDSVEQPVAAPVVEEAVVPAPDGDAPPGTPGPAFLRIGAGAHLGAVSAGTGYEADLIYGFELAWTAPELWAIGVRDLSGSGVPRGEGGRVDLAPFVELGWTAEFLTLYGQLGAQLQVVARTDLGINRMGVAPLVVAGARFRLASMFSIAIETAIRVVASDTLTTSLHELPQLAVPWTGGITALFHIN